MKKVFYPLVSAACLLCVSCSDQPANLPVDVPDVISVSASVVNVTRAVSEEGVYKNFEVGDEISVFVWTGSPSDGALSLGQTAVNNVLNRYEGNSVWTPDTYMYWADAEVPVEHSFAAVYPAVSLVLPGAMKGEYDVEGGLVEDVLVARVDGQLPTSEPVELVFDHVMALLEVNLTLRDEFSGVDPASVYVTVDAAADAVVDYIAASSAAVGTAAEYRLSASANGLKHSAVLPAQTVPMNLGLHIGDAVRTLKRDGLDLVLESGKRTKVNLTVGKDFVELTGVSAEPWNDGGSSSVGTDEMTDTKISFNVDVADAVTRAGYDAGPLTEGAIGFYMQTAGAENLDAAAAGKYTGANRKIEYKNGEWATEGYPMLWMNSEAEVSWQAYYPYNEADVADGILTVTIPTDQAKDGVLDLLYAQGTTTGAASKEEGIKVELEHMFAKLIVSLSVGTELGDVEFESVVISDLDTKATFNISNTDQMIIPGNIISYLDAIANINMIKVDDTTFEAILLPYNSAAFSMEITLKGGRKFYYTRGFTELTEGQVHTLNIKVGTDKVETTSAGITTKAWTE